MVAHASLWQDLDSRSKAPLVWFQSFEWCRNWIEIHGSKRVTPVVLLLTSRDKAVAIWPMMRQKKGLGVNTLRTLGEPHSQYANILTETGTLTRRETDLLRDAFQRLVSVDTAQFPYVPAGSPLAQVLSGETALPELANESAQLNLGVFASPAAYDATLSKKTMRNLRRGERLLADQGELTFQMLRPGMPRYRDMIDAAIAMKKVWLAQTGRMGEGLQYDGHGRFLSAMHAVSDGADGTFVFALTHAGKPIAVEVGFLQRGHYYCYLGSFDWTLRNASPGKVQMHRTIAWLIEHGVETYDLLANPAEYKRDYSNAKVVLSGHAINLTSRGVLYTSLWTRTLKPMLRAAFVRLPDPLRNALAALRRKELKISA